MRDDSLLLRNAEIRSGVVRDVRIRNGVVVEVGEELKGEELMDVGGGALLPGLCDHHAHVFGFAAQLSSIDVSPARTARDMAALLKPALADAPYDAWVRVGGYHQNFGGDLDRDALDRLAPLHRLRVQHASGKLWVLNTRALDAVHAADGPDCVERDAAGRATGRIWRGDAWLGERIGRRTPDLARVARHYLMQGVTSVTDASATNTESSFETLAKARLDGRFPLRIRAMSGELMDQCPADIALGELKILLDEDDAPDFDALCARVRRAAAAGRAPAFHCVTHAELAIALAVLEACNHPSGARIEHGSLIPQTAIKELRRAKATVVTQPVFLCDRGDRYATDIEPSDVADLYRVRSLLKAGVRVAGSSDAPYGDTDPWRGMAAAVGRTTVGGRVLSSEERVRPVQALEMYLGAPDSPGCPRRVEIGQVADLCVLAEPLAAVLDAPRANAVRSTFIGGVLAYDACRSADAPHLRDAACAPG